MGGQYVSDKKDGFGILTWCDGNRYEGYWLEGYFHGFGRFGRMALWSHGTRIAWVNNVNGMDDEEQDEEEQDDDTARTNILIEPLVVSTWKGREVHIRKRL